MINYILASLIAAAGIICGAALAIMAKEEIKPGLVYFKLAKNILFAAITLIMSFYYLSINPVISGIILIPLAFLAIKRFQDELFYMTFAVIYALSTGYETLFLLVSSLIFITGFPAGTLAYYKASKNRRWLRITLPSFIFVFIVLIISYFY